MIALATARIMMLSSVVKPVSAPPLLGPVDVPPSKEYPCRGEMIVMIVLIIIIKR